MAEQNSIVAKMLRVYAAIDFVEKAGKNVSQNYKYVRAADVVHAVRKAFIEEKLYAEINFDFCGDTFLIARAKEKDTPFTGIRVRCYIVVHDLESDGLLTASGLGTGVDSSDKAVYKAQTGGLKYALRHLALLPDEADPEADESVDDDRQSGHVRPDPPDFQEAQKPAPRPAPAAKQEPVPAAKAAAAPAEAASASDATLPTEEQMKSFREQFKKLGDDLSSEGKFKASKGLPVNRKLLVFLLSITKADSAEKITVAQWNNFFERVVKVTGTKAEPIAGGFVALAKLINKTNGITDKSEAAAE